jgi:hypothetical protein
MSSNLTNAAVYPTLKQAVLTQWRLRQDWQIAAGLGLLTLFLRLPFGGQTLYHWDSINFALSLQHFDVAKGQPHVPGYILYVFLGQMVNALVNDAQLTLTGLSVVSSGLAVACLYGLGLAMFDRSTGLLSALFLASSPLFWFYGEIVLPHSLDTLMVIVSVWLLYRLSQGQTTLAVPAALWLGLAGGFRPQTQVFLAPLALYAGWGLGWRRGLLALAALVIVDLAWLIPLFWLSGGPARYFEIMTQFSDQFNATTSILSGAGLFGLTRNLTKLSMYTLYGWSLALLPILVVFFNVQRSTFNVQHLTRADARFWFILLWIAPSIAYYTFIHMGQQGLVFVFLPALLLLSAAGFYRLRWPSPFFRQMALVVLILGNTVTFVAAPTYPLGSDRLKLLTADTLRRHDADYEARFAAVRSHFVAAHTALLSSGWRFPDYYLPDYTLLPYTIFARWEQGEGLPTQQTEAWLTGPDMGLQPDTNGFFYIVLFDQNLLPYNHSAERLEWLAVPGESPLAFLRFTTQERVQLGPEGFEIEP